MQRYPSLRERSPRDQLEDLYWLHWCGEDGYARRKLIEFTDDYLKGKPPNVETKTTQAKRKDVLLPVGGTNADDYRGAFAD